MSKINRNYSWVKVGETYHILLGDPPSIYVINPTHWNYLQITRMINLQVDEIHFEDVVKPTFDIPPKTSTGHLLTQWSTPLKDFPQLLYNGTIFKYVSNDIDQELPEVICHLLAGLITAKVNCTKFVNFIERCLKAHKQLTISQVEQLVTFLSANNAQFVNSDDTQRSCTIIEDGSLILMKRVRGDQTDVYTGKVPNYIGSTIYMDRDEVDSNPDRLCSNGLHACTPSYLRNGFGAGDDPIDLLILVKPEDIISIPNEYENAKLRVSRYTVIGTTPELNYDYSEEGHFNKTGKLLKKSANYVKIDSHGNVLQTTYKDPI